MAELMEVSARDRERRLATLSNDDLRRTLAQVVGTFQRQRKERQLYFYRPASEQAWQVYEADARVVGIGGGNGSSKTESCLVEMLVRATGVVPHSWKERGIDWESKLRGPIQCRVVCESLTTVLHPIILPKLQWWKWTGVDAPGGERGHWGWIPRDHLIGGDWQKSWSEKLRTLRLLYRNPENPAQVGESSIQFMSVDQDPSDFASGDFHFVLHDEPPTLAIWRENEARTMRVGGKLYLAMTWPDDPAIAVDWIHDEVYEPGLDGPGRDPRKRWITLWTTENAMLDQGAIAEQSESWSEETRRVRLRGESIRFSNRVHPGFTETEATWCFRCGRDVPASESVCGLCESPDVARYSHVVPDDHSRVWPCAWLLDPHPRKPHMFLWVQVTPQDDLFVVAEGSVDGDPVRVRDYVLGVEAELGLRVGQRWIDPNMGASPSSAQIRGQTWRDEFDEAGLACDLADCSDVGRARINQYLEPDLRTWRPRLTFHPRAEGAIYQMKRYCWDEHRRGAEKDLKQRPKDKNDDYPTLLKYLLNSDPQFSLLDRSGQEAFRSRPATRLARVERWDGRTA